jgi:hypothetical protein
VNDELERMRTVGVLTCLKVLSHHLPGMMDQSHGRSPRECLHRTLNLSRISGCPKRFHGFLDYLQTNTTQYLEGKNSMSAESRTPIVQYVSSHFTEDAVAFWEGGLYPLEMIQTKDKLKYGCPARNCTESVSNTYPFVTDTSIKL